MDRFWGRVQRQGSAECWLWKGALGRKGYGKIRVNGASMYAHRLAWHIHYGPIPEGLCVLHKCDRRNCVNPAHLFLGSIQDNNADCESKDRHTRGERVHTAKLSAPDVIYIRMVVTPGHPEYSIGALARRFGVTACTVADILHRRTWAHLPEPAARAPCG